MPIPPRITVLGWLGPGGFGGGADFATVGFLLSVAAGGVFFLPDEGDQAKPILGDQLAKSVFTRLRPKALLRMNGRYWGEFGSEMKRAGGMP